MKQRETFFIVSEDGKRGIGKSYVVEDDKTSENFQALSQNLMDIINECANDYENDARTCAELSNKFVDRIEQLKTKIKRVKIRSTYFQKKIAFWKNIRRYSMLGLSLLGFFGGFLLTIVLILKLHGPTDSIASTAISFLVALVSGVVLCLILCGLAKNFTNRFIKSYKRLLTKNEEIIADLTCEKTISTLEAEKFYKLKNAKWEKSRKYRGLH
jgi:hypothetical protein